MTVPQTFLETSEFLPTVVGESHLYIEKQSTQRCQKGCELRRFDFDIKFLKCLSFLNWLYSLFMHISLTCYCRQTEVWPKVGGMEMVAVDFGVKLSNMTPQV